jgi:hypothetical protein
MNTRLCDGFLADEFREREPALAAQLKRDKLPNCGVIALRVDFDRPVGRCVDDVRLLFGTTLASSRPPNDRRISVRVNSNV